VWALIAEAGIRFPSQVQASAFFARETVRIDSGTNMRAHNQLTTNLFRYFQYFRYDSGNADGIPKKVLALALKNSENALVCV